MTYKDYKITAHNSAVCGYPGRNFNWSKFDWEGKAIYKTIFKGDKNLKACKPFADNSLFFITKGNEYLHVPYNFEEAGTIYRVRPNESMQAGHKYRGHVIKETKAIKKKDGWYWRLIC